MNIILSALSSILFCASVAYAQLGITIPLWENSVPGALGTNEWDMPTLTHYSPDHGITTGASMVILPGGGYGGLAAHEEEGYARWFNQHGINAFVVKYRLGSRGYRHPVMLQDAARAARLVRSMAK